MSLDQLSEHRSVEHRLLGVWDDEEEAARLALFSECGTGKTYVFADPPGGRTSPWMCLCSLRAPRTSEEPGSRPQTGRWPSTNSRTAPALHDKDVDVTDPRRTLRD